MPLAIDRAWIERRIPHQGRMCLIDEVVDIYAFILHAFGINAASG